MVFSDEDNMFTSQAAIFLAAMSYQTYLLYFEGELILPKGFQLRYTIRASADVENPTEHMYGFVAESKEEIIIAFRGYAAYPADLLAAYDILQIPYPFVTEAGKTFTWIYMPVSVNTRSVTQKNKSVFCIKKAVYYWPQLRWRTGCTGSFRYCSKHAV